MPKASIVKDSVEFQIGDQVLLRQGGPEDLPYVARIDRIGAKDRKSGYELLVTWYYRPEDVGRRVSLLQIVVAVLCLLPCSLGYNTTAIFTKQEDA
jgi:hypothetical protein